MAFSIERRGNTSLGVFDGSDPVCDVHDLRLRSARFRRRGKCLIGAEVPLPLFWEQYANHEDPERNSGSHGSVRVMQEGADRIVIGCTGTTFSGSVLSEYVVTINRRTDQQTYSYDVLAALRVAEGASWLVTHNPYHGELEFCNFWPDGAFSTDMRKPLRYGACYVVRKRSVQEIPHHHLETAEKHNIPIQPGDRMMWLLEDENPCIEFLSGGNMLAGVCAYMWDAHLAYRVCTDEADRVLDQGAQYTASFRLLSLSRDEGRSIVAAAVRASPGEEKETPIVADGVQRFSETFANTKLSPDRVWPWETEVVSGAPGGVGFLLDREVGLDDHRSLRIEAAGAACARWKATALGPAFRQAPFVDGARYRLKASVRTRLTAGHVSAAIRLHRKGNPGLFDPDSYEIHASPPTVSGFSEWIQLDILTPAITPAPDRVHLLLELNGVGICWFDNVHFTREE